MQRKIALLLGNGGYALSLQRRLRVEAQIAAMTVALFPRRDLAALGDKHVTLYGGMFRPTHAINQMRRQGITHVVLGGDVRLASLGLPDKMKLQAHSIVDPILKQMLLSFRRGSAIAALNIFSDAVRKAGIEPLLASDLLPDLKPGVGPIARHGRFAEMDDASLRRHVSQLAAIALKELRHQPFANVRQAILFDGHTIKLRETQSTDTLLREAANEPRTDAPRTMVKLCTTHFDHRMDPPVVGLKTFENARKAGVDMIIVDAHLGILHERDDVTKICAHSGISIFGYDPAAAAA